MKTLILVEECLDSPQRFTEAKLPSIAIRMLAESFGKNRRPGALLLIERGADGQPVYLTIGSHPPELHVGDRTMWGVCSPIESQDPIAVFMEKDAAKAWAEAQGAPYRLMEVGADSGAVPRVSVAVICHRQGKTLLGRLTSGMWTLPEGLLNFGEPIDVAAQRILTGANGMRATKISLSRTAPFVNTHYADLRRHFVTLVSLADTNADDTPSVLNPAWVEWDWFDTRAAPPAPLLPAVLQLMRMAAAAAEAPLQTVSL